MQLLQLVLLPLLVVVIILLFLFCFTKGSSDSLGVHFYAWVGQFVWKRQFSATPILSSTAREVRTVKVMAKERLPPHAHKTILSDLDVMVSKLPSPSGYLFHTTLNDDKLVEALSLLLNIFPQMGGTIVAAGATSVEVHHEEPFINLKIVQESIPAPTFFPYSKSYANQLADNINLNYPVSYDAHVSSLKVVHYVDNKTCIYMRVNHALMDGTGRISFMRAWGELYRGHSVSIMPDHNRSKVIIDEGEGGRYVSDQRIQQLGNSYPVNLLAELYRMGLHASKGVHTRHFLFSPTDIAKMKQSVKSGKAGAQMEGKILSTNDVLSAYFWKIMAEVNVSVTDDEEFHLHVVFNFRGKLAGVASNYFGNAVITAPVSVKKGDLLRKDLSELVLLIRNTVDATQEDSVKDILQYLRNRVKTYGYAGFANLGGMDLSKGVILNNYTKFSFLDVEFEDKCTVQRYVMEEMPMANIGTILPTVTGDVEVVMPFTTEAMEKFNIIEKTMTLAF